jgi:polynucleotide kinase-phosphatase
VAYARVSTEDQAKGYGVQYSTKKILRHIERKSWRHVGTFCDEGISGSLEAHQRGDLNKLMELAREKPKPFDIVVVNEGRAIGRTGRAFWRWVWELEDMGIYVGVVQDDYDNTTVEGRKKMRRDADYAETEWETIRQRTQGGLQEKAEEGGWVGGPPPYGYEIEDQGKKGLSRLIKCAPEVKVLRRARELLVEFRLNMRQTAARLNAEGLFTRSGKPWSHQYLRARLMSTAVLEAVFIFRNTKVKNGRGPKLDQDGKPLYGETVRIELDPIFEPGEVADLKAAVGEPSGKPKGQAGVYPLSRRVIAQCGKHYIGGKRHKGPGRWYRCKGRQEEFAHAPTCDDPQIPAAELEQAVWAEVVNLLGDPDQLKAMAAEWVGLAESSEADHQARVDDLNRQIAAREQAIKDTVKSYMRSGLPADLLDEVLADAKGELEQITEMRDEAKRWMEETEAAEQRANDLAALAELARTRLSDMEPAEQGEILALLDVRVTITGPMPERKTNKGCTLTKWFDASGRLVPPPLTDETWAKVEPIVRAWEPPNHRLIDGRAVVDGILFKARTGCGWHGIEVPEGVNWKTVHTRFNRWMRAGVWDEIMKVVPNEGTLSPGMPVLPPFKIEGRVDPRVMPIRHEESPAETPMVEVGTALCVPGNHENKLGRYLKGRQVQHTHGLAETIEQLGEQDKHDPGFRRRVQRFIDGLVSHYVLDGGRLVVCHAGLPEKYHGRTSGRVRSHALYGDTTGETDEFGLPVRYPWAEDYRGRAAVVYGHTPVPTTSWINNTICLDTGAVFGGRMTALRWPEREIVDAPAERVWYEPVKPLVTEAPGGREGRPLDLGDVAGRRVVETSRMGRLAVREENAAAALEVMSRFAVDPRLLAYLPPTMSPCATSQRDGYLEHPAEAFAAYREDGVRQVVCEEKHMGSRAVALVCRDEEAARKRFGVAGVSGALHTRTGRPFFDDAAVTEQVLARVREAVTAAGLWEELATDWLLLDAELLPWSLKASGLLRKQYAVVGAAAGAVFPPALAALEAAVARGTDVSALLARQGERAADASAFTEAYRRYCWTTDGLDGVRPAPFQLLAVQDRSLAALPHDRQLALIDRLVAADPTGLLRTTAALPVDTGDETSVAAGVRWWLDLTAAGGEGMVVKPLAALVRTEAGRLVQPGIKCRGREYLRIIYGPDYTRPEHLTRLRHRSVGHKRSLALREYALGLESLDRLAANEPLWRVHEAVFAVLALESEPVDPRL